MQYITYTIRFQNVGNDTAFNIYINDTLDNNLDWNTIQPISSSHDYNFEQINGKYLTFNFLNIQLPDSNTNQTLSHGYISFKIKPKNNLLLDDIISNKASIVFDVNVPIVTNDVQTNIAELRSSSVVINCSENSSSDQPFIIQRKPYDALPQSYWTGATVDGFVQGVSQINFTFNNVPSGMNVTAAVNSGGQVVILVNSIIQSNLVEFELEICDATTNACCTQHIHFYSIPPKVVAKNDTIHFSSLQAGQDYFINVFNNDRYFSEYPENNYVTIPILSNGNWAVKANYQLSLDENTNEIGSSSTTSIANITTNNNSNSPDRLQNNIFYQPKNNLTTQYNVKDTFTYYVCPCSYYTNYSNINCSYSEYYNLQCDIAIIYVNVDTLKGITNPRIFAGQDQTICQGQSATLTATGGSNYTWSNNQSGASITVSPTITTMYIVTGTVNSVQQKDTVIVIVKPRTTFNNNQSICAGQTYTINGKTYSTAGTYRDTLRNANSQGCDSIIVTNLTIKNLPDVNFTKSINNNTVVFTAPNGNDSYTWTFGDGNSSSIQNPTHTYQSIGNYNITLQSTLNSCSNSKSDSVSIISTAIKNNISFVDKIEVYPNPTDRFLTISIKSNKTADFSLILTSLDGKIIYEKFTENTIHVNEKIDMSQVATGMYFLKVISKGEQAIIKILKK
jgi:PKD repeat protein